MAIKYNGTEVIHIYKGVEIRKRETYCFGTKSITYTIGNYVFIKLKDAKAHIDRISANKA